MIGKIRIDIRLLGLCGLYIRPLYLLFRQISGQIVQFGFVDVLVVHFVFQLTEKAHMYRLSLFFLSICVTATSIAYCIRNV